MSEHKNDIRAIYEYFAKQDANARPWESLHPQVRDLLRFFDFSQLPVNLQVKWEPFCQLACRVARGPQNAETTVAIRKLLEAQDAAGRAWL